MPSYGSFSDSSGDTDTDSGEEIWETSGSEAEQDKVERQAIKDVLFGLSILLFAFRVSEHAMHTLLAFLKTLTLHFSRACSTDSLMLLKVYQKLAMVLGRFCH